MPKTLAPHLRAVESRAEPAAVGDYCGTSHAAKLLGLSVATVQSLVEKGDIEAWKTQGGHRRISMRSVNSYLQRYFPHAVPSPAPVRALLRVMVVEEDERRRFHCAAAIEGWELAVECRFAPSALDALMEVLDFRPDLFITDVSLPDVDGIGMLRVMQAHEQLRGMQVLVASAASADDIEDRGGLPAEAILRPKPLNMEWLHGYVSALLAARQASAG